jgi:hypothetical protein
MSDSTTETHHPEAASAPDLPRVPTVNANGVKIYPTSFIPTKAHMENSRIPTVKMEGLTIEVIHVVIFFILTIALFYSIWKRPNVR